MDKNITITVSLAKVSESAEKELLSRAQDLADDLTAIYGAEVSLKWTANK